MTITTQDALVNAMCNATQGGAFYKAAIASKTVGMFYSFWASRGWPVNGATPTTAVVPTSATTGAFPFTNPGAGVDTYLSKFAAMVCNALEPGSVILFDRLIHNSVTGNGLTAVNTPPLPGRGERSDGGNVEWYLEAYDDGNLSTINCTVTYTDGVTNVGSKTVVVPIVGTIRAGCLIPILPNANQTIKSIESLNFASDTGLANVGVTACRRIAAAPILTNALSVTYDALQTGLSVIADNACLFLAQVVSISTTNTQLSGELNLIQG